MTKVDPILVPITQQCSVTALNSCCSKFCVRFEYEMMCGRLVIGTIGIHVGVHHWLAAVVVKIAACVGISSCFVCA